MSWNLALRFGSWRTPRLVMRLLGLLALLAATGGLGVAAPARAEIVSLSAMGFSMHCPCTVDKIDDSSDNNGTLEINDQFVRLYAGVDFPVGGQRVCSMSLVYRDVNANDAIRARLFRKTFATGGNAFAAPTLIATATSASGTTSTIRIAKTTSINQPVINETNAFYYVLVDAPTINLAFLGVQLDVRSAC